jgi:hypothetical protein
MSDQQEDDEFVTRIGPVEVDWPRSFGYFAGVGVAVALDLIAPPLALFIVAVPFLKLLKRRDAPLAQRAIAAVLEGAAKPVGGDSEGTLRLADEKEDQDDGAAPRRGDAGEAPKATSTTRDLSVS